MLLARALAGECPSLDPMALRLAERPRQAKPMEKNSHNTGVTSVNSAIPRRQVAQQQRPTRPAAEQEQPQYSAQELQELQQLRQRATPPVAPYTLLETGPLGAAGTGIVATSDQGLHGGLQARLALL